jgi:hypothetical protein
MSKGLKRTTYNKQSYDTPITKRSFTRASFFLSLKRKSPPPTNLFLKNTHKTLYISYLNTNSPILLSCKKILETFFVYLVFCSTFAAEKVKSEE